MEAEKDIEDAHLESKYESCFMQGRCPLLIKVDIWC